MRRSRAHIRTETPSVNMRKLLRHFGHKIEVQFDDYAGSAAFPFGNAHLETRESRLVIHLEAPDKEALERLQEVISSHLVRFASNESLNVNWEPVSK